MFAMCLTEDAAKQLNSLYGETGMLLAVQMDVTSEESVRQAQKTVDEALGSTGGLDALVNNAGIMVGSVTELTPISVFRKTMDVNFLGTVSVTQTFLPMLKLSKNSPRIINIASIAGRMSCHSFGPYSASKFAVEAFTTALRQEMAEWNIQVAMVEPGFHGTALLPLYTANLKRCFEQSPAELQRDYGEEYLNSQIHSFDWMKKLCVGKPVNVVSKIVDCCVAKDLGARHVIGFDAKYLFLPATYLPDWLYDALSLVVTKVTLPERMRQKKF